jgi:hypothetical protein
MIVAGLVYLVVGWALGTPLLTTVGLVLVVARVALTLLVGVGGGERRHAGRW